MSDNAIGYLPTGDPHRQPLTDEEQYLPQYGPAWISHVLAGGDVRHGNVIVARLTDEQIAKRIAVLTTKRTATR